MLGVYQLVETTPMDYDINPALKGGQETCIHVMEGIISLPPN